MLATDSVGIRDVTVAPETGTTDPTPAVGRGTTESTSLARGVHVLVGVAIVWTLALKFQLVSSININWDEFLYLSQVLQFDRGELTTAFQTFHVHLFQWLVRVPGNEIDQMLAARYALFGLRVAGTALVFLLALRVAGRGGALVAALASVTFSYVLRHGESFRADPLIAFLFLLAAVLLVWRLESAVAMVVAGIAVALAASISIKTVIYVPALAGLVIAACLGVDSGSRALRLRRAALFGVAATLAAITLYWLHAGTTGAAGSEVLRRGTASGAGMLWSPQLDVLARTVRWDWLFWLLATGGAVGAAFDSVRGTRAERTRARMVVALLLPLATVILYRNSFPYFYVALVPLASVACGYVMTRIGNALSSRESAGVMLLSAAALVLRGWEFAEPLRRDGIALQRGVVTAVHSIFPDPVPYLDRCGMVGSFPRAPIFMSTYILAKYRARGVPMMPELVAATQPGFLLANTRGLALHRPWDFVRTSERRLLREDFEFLQNNFVHHWGPVWIPGKRIALSPSGQSFEIVVGGPYTVESESPVWIDGVMTRPRDVIHLAPGMHQVRGEGTVTLRAGARLHRPTGSWRPQRIFWPL